MELLLFVADVPLRFVRPGTPPAQAPEARSWLVDVSGLALAARGAAFEQLANAPEGASISVKLDNAGRQASQLLGRPLRVCADVYDDDDELYFAGIVQAIEYGPNLTLQIEA